MLKSQHHNMGKPRGSKDINGSSDRALHDCPDQTEPLREGGPLEHALPSNFQLHLDKVLEAITASREALKQK